MPSVRRIAARMVGVLILAHAAWGWAWNTNVETWRGPWDSEHRQIGYAALMRIRALAYADYVHAVPAGGTYADRQTGTRHGRCARFLRRESAGKLTEAPPLPGQIRRTDQEGLCLRDLNLWWSQEALLDPQRRSPLEKAALERFVARNPDIGNEGTTLLEERFLPDTDHFVEMPDASYSMYDWVRKNTVTTVDPRVENDYSDASKLDIIASAGKLGGHMFEGWLGATNASHFGDSAFAHWQRYHHVALDLAARAAELRQRLAPRFPSHPHWRDVVEEAEREALAYEGAAQHYLTDRWSAGHMWNRWGSADARSIASVGYPRVFGATALTGLIHGSQSVLGGPMPLSSPAILTNLAGRYGYGHPDPCLPLSSLEQLQTHPHIGVCEDGLLTLWAVTEGFAAEDGTSIDRRPFYVDPGRCTAPGCWTGAEVIGIRPTQALFPGRGLRSVVGDYRWPDLLRNAWAAEEKVLGQARVRPWPGGSLPFPIDDAARGGALQAAMLIDCSARSFAEVIRRLGRGASGGYGLLGAQIPDEVAGSIDLGAGAAYEGCWQTWATNESFRTAIRLLGLYSIRDVSRAEIVFTSILNQAAPAVLGLKTLAELGVATAAQRVELAALTAVVRVYARTRPEGTDLARGALPPLFNVSADRRLAEFVEPERLEDAPDSAAQGEVSPLSGQPYFGRDKRTVYGLFNRAHARYWCEKSAPKDGPEGSAEAEDAYALFLDRDYEGGEAAIADDNSVYLSRLRRPSQRAPRDAQERLRFDANLEVCELLATRKWRGSFAMAYKSDGRVPARRVSYQQQPYERYDSLCNALGSFDGRTLNGLLGEPRSARTDWSKLGEPARVVSADAMPRFSLGGAPYFIPRNYAPAYPMLSTDSADVAAVHEHGLDLGSGYPQTVVNWCQKIPVIDSVVEPSGLGDEAYLRALLGPSGYRVGRTVIPTWNNTTLRTRWYAARPGLYDPRRHQACTAAEYRTSSDCFNLGAVSLYSSYARQYMDYTAYPDGAVTPVGFYWPYGYLPGQAPAWWRDLFRRPALGENEKRCHLDGQRYYLDTLSIGRFDPGDALLGGTLYLRGNNFGRAGKVEFHHLQSGAIVAMVRSGDPGVVWKPGRRTVDASAYTDADSVAFPTPTLAPGEYLVTLTNETDPQRPRTSMKTTRVSIACPFTHPSPGAGWQECGSDTGVADVTANWLPTERSCTPSCPASLDLGWSSSYAGSSGDNAIPCALMQTLSCTTEEDCQAKVDGPWQSYPLSIPVAPGRSFFTQCVYTCQALDPVTQTTKAFRHVGRSWNDLYGLNP